MLILEDITLQNFMSIGNVPSKVDLNTGHLTLVLGENQDMGDDEGARNGVGKSTIANAILYALEDRALTNIKKDNLINNTNKKNMEVILNFSKDDVKYRIVRGRKPNKLHFFVDGRDINDSDQSLGDSRDTQTEIQKVTGLSHAIIKHILALNTYTEPFLTMSAADQRVIIEQLLGITRLSEKAEALKIEIKATKDEIARETIIIDTNKAANERVLASIESMNRNKIRWDAEQEAKLIELCSYLEKLYSIDVDQEIANHAHNDVVIKNKTARDSLEREKSRITSDIMDVASSVEDLESNLAIILDKKCPMCHQGVCDDNHEELIISTVAQIESKEIKILNLNDRLAQINADLSAIPIHEIVSTHYKTISEAHVHKTNVENLMAKIAEHSESVNPYIRQIEDTRNVAMKELSWDTVNNLSNIHKHQELLLKLLTHRDSYVRKRIIEHNLSHLNSRLSHYLEKMGLPHRVVFQSDLTVEITYMGRDLDFDNLSRGERNRLILSLSWTFRDIFESMYFPINLMMIDELIDNGLDPSGVEAALKVLKHMNMERNKTVLLISHRDELHGRVSSVLKVIKKRGFTTFVAQ